MFRRLREKRYSIFISIIYGLFVVFGLCRFRYIKATGRMKVSKFLEVYSFILLTILMLVAPMTIMNYCNFLREFHRSEVGEIISIQMFALDSAIKYAVFVIIYLSLHYYNLDLLELINSAFDLLRIVRMKINNSNSSNCKFFSIAVFMLTFNIVTMTDFIYFNVRFCLRSQVADVCCINFYLVLCTICACFEYIRSCAFLYATTLYKILNCQLENLSKLEISDGKTSKKLMEITENRRKVSEFVGKLLRVFKYETIGLQLSLFVMIAAEVRCA